MGAEVVDQDLAVDFGGVERRAAFPEEVGLFAYAFDEEIDFAADPGALALGGDFLLQAHELAAAGLNGAAGELGFVGELEGLGALFI